MAVLHAEVIFAGQEGQRAGAATGAARKAAIGQGGSRAEMN